MPQAEVAEEDDNEDEDESEDEDEDEEDEDEDEVMGMLPLLFLTNYLSDKSYALCLLS